jgi:hypothetical protein
MWRGTFTGPPDVMQWERISDNVGCVGMYAATVINGVLYWLGDGGLYYYTGTAPQLLPVPIQDTLRGSLLITAFATKALSQVSSDAAGQSIYVLLHVVATAATTVIKVNLLNLKPSLPGRTQTHQFNRGFFASHAAGVVTLYQVPISNAQITTALSDLRGFGLHYLGSDHEDTLLRCVIPRLATAPDSFKCTDYYGPTMSEALANQATAVTVSATPWRADLTKAARWHAPRLHFSSVETDPEIIDVMLDVQKGGRA